MEHSDIGISVGKASKYGAVIKSGVKLVTWNGIPAVAKSWHTDISRVEMTSFDRWSWFRMKLLECVAWVWVSWEAHEKHTHGWPSISSVLAAAGDHVGITLIFMHMIHTRIHREMQSTRICNVRARASIEITWYRSGSYRRCRCGSECFLAVDILKRFCFDCLLARPGPRTLDRDIRSCHPQARESDATQRRVRKSLADDWCWLWKSLSLWTYRNWYVAYHPDARMVRDISLRPQSFD